MPLLEIPDDFRAFMAQVVAYLDIPGDDKNLDAEDALRHEVGYGGRIDGREMYRFCYFTRDGHHRWELVLREQVVRDIADGFVIDIEGTRHELVRTRDRAPTGEPLLVWGEYGEDALLVSDHGRMIHALDWLHRAAMHRPRMLRLWSACDDQVVAVVYRDHCALYVVASLDGYATSAGDLARTDSFEVADHDGTPFSVPYTDCVPWDRARNALLNFFSNGTLGPEIRTDGRIPSLLLMMGDVDRAAALAARAEPPRQIRRSSLPRLLTPIPDTIDEAGEPTEPVEVDSPLRLEQLGAWAARLLELLGARQLIELGPAGIAGVAPQLRGLLGERGTEAIHSLETAEQLADALGAMPGVHKLFASASDLQVALRRSR